jgi:ABC-type nitrate/sulfonate/bicarbonate transport system substrate-binding protein
MRIVGLFSLVVLLAACGGSAAPSAAPASAPQPAVSAAASAKPPASASAKPAASASAKPAGSGSAAAKPAASGLTRVKAAYSQVSAAQGALYAAIDNGFFAKYGIDVDLGQVAGTQQVPALQANELQFGTPGGNELVSSVLAGAPMVALAVSSNYMLQSLYGGKGVTDVKQVEGKPIAITTAGSTSEAGAKLFLRHYGLDKKVQYQPAGTVAGVAAVLEKGDAAGGVTSPPTTIQLEKAGLKELVNGPKFEDPAVHAAVMVTRDYLKNNQDTVKRFLQGYVDGWRFAIDRANEPAMVKTLAKWTKSDDATAKASYEFVVEAWARDKIPAVNQKAVENIMSIVDNPKARDAKPADFYDNSLIEAVAKG